MRSNRDPDSILSALSRDCGVLAQKDPLIWNWSVLSNLFLVVMIRNILLAEIVFKFVSMNYLWSKMNSCALEDSSLRSIFRRVMQFYKPTSNQFCQCEFNSSRTRLYSVVGCFLMDSLTVVEEVTHSL